MIANDDDIYDSMSEEEMDALEHVAMHRRVNEDEDDQVFCDNDSSLALVVSKVLTLQHQQEEYQCCHIFHTKVGINGQSMKVIIDGGSFLVRSIAWSYPWRLPQLPKHQVDP